MRLRISNRITNKQSGRLFSRIGQETCRHRRCHHISCHQRTNKSCSGMEGNERSRDESKVALEEE